MLTKLHLPLSVAQLHGITDFWKIKIGGLSKTTEVSKWYNGQHHQTTAPTQNVYNAMNIKQGYHSPNTTKSPDFSSAKTAINITLR